METEKEGFPRAAKFANAVNELLRLAVRADVV